MDDVMAVFMAVFLAKLLDPVGFVVALIVVMFSRKKWIILLAAVLAALVVETMLSSIQHTRTWGQGLPIGFLVGLVHASTVFAIRWWFNANRQLKRGSPNETKPL
jgi:hypothetical protein